MSIVWSRGFQLEAKVQSVLLIELLIKDLGPQTSLRASLHKILQVTSFQENRGFLWFNRSVGSKVEKCSYHSQSPHQVIYFVALRCIWGRSRTLLPMGSLWRVLLKSRWFLPRSSIWWRTPTVFADPKTRLSICCTCLWALFMIILKKATRNCLFIVA